MLVLCGAVGIDGGADDAHFVGGRDDFEAAALQRAHLDHVVHQPVQQSAINKLHFRSGDKKCSWAFHVDAGRRGSSQCAVAQGNKFFAARVTGAGVFENFFWFEIHKPQTHRTAPEDSFEMSLAAAAAELFLGVEANDRMPAFPDSFPGRETAEADAVADGPNAEQFVQCSARGRNSRGHDVGVIEKMNVRAGEFAAQRGGQGGLEGKAFGLLEVRRVLDDAVANDAWEADANRGDFFPLRNFLNLLPDAVNDTVRGHGLQRVERLCFLRKDVERAEHLVVLHEANGDMFHDQYTDCPAHCAPANLKGPSLRAIGSSHGRDYVLASLFKPLNAAAL